MSLMNQDQEFMWVQKWRPASKEDLVIPASMRNAIDKFEEMGKVHHMVLVSPSPGTGKTSTSVVIAKTVGCERPLIINASKNTDIATIRKDVFDYATGSSLFNRKGMKVVVLDEVDRLSAQAQDALKGILEEVSHVCAFILTTNHPHAVNEKLMSRCMELSFTFTDEDYTQCAIGMAKRCAHILKSEGVKYDQRVVANVVKRCAPDYRNCVKVLQQMYLMYGEINAAALSVLDRMNLAPLADAIVALDYVAALKWTTDNSRNIGPGFYRELYDALKPKMDPQAMPLVIDILGEEQKFHHGCPDMFMHVQRINGALMGVFSN